jgi:hypothetical protein
VAIWVRIVDSADHYGVAHCGQLALSHVKNVEVEHVRLGARGQILGGFSSGSGGGSASFNPENSTCAGRTSSQSRTLNKAIKIHVYIMESSKNNRQRRNM